MAQDVRDVAGRDPRVQRDEHRSGERHGVVRGEQYVRVGREYGDAVARFDAKRTQSAGKAQAALVKRAPREAHVAVDDADAVGEDMRGSVQEIRRRERSVAEIRLHPGYGRSLPATSRRWCELAAGGYGTMRDRPHAKNVTKRSG